MKKVMKLACLLTSVMLSTTPVFASDMIKIYLDGSQMPTEAKLYDGKGGSKESKYYLDVMPEIKEDRVYVPINLITKLLDIPMVWESPNITLTYKGKTLGLTVGKATAAKDGELLTLDAPPYISGGRTMVPLRFVTEAFDLGVSYSDNIVHLQTPKLNINHTYVDVIQTEYNMTMGSVVSESNSNLCISRMREVFESSKSANVTAPSFFGTMHDIDAEHYYYQQKQYRFIDANDQVIESYEVYYGLSYGMHTETYLLRDRLNDKWYAFSEEDYYILEELETLSEWIEVSNTVV